MSPDKNVKNKPDISLESINSKREAKEALDELREAIHYHDHRYYMLDDPGISNPEYDELMHKLTALEEWSPELVSPDSPTQRVGEEPREELGTVEHPSPMLNLNAIYDEEELARFFESYRRRLDETPEYIAEPMYDGLSLELIYEDGGLSVAATRGDGRTGEDVTANAKRSGSRRYRYHSTFSLGSGVVPDL